MLPSPTIKYYGIKGRIAFHETIHGKSPFLHLTISSFVTETQFMLKRNGFHPTLTSFIAVLTIFISAGLTGCDRGASDQVGAARRFADAVANNDAHRRDTMIATQKLKEFFSNPFVARDMISWFRSFYDLKNK